MNKFRVDRSRVSPNLILSGIFFLVSMSLDFYITNVSSHGDYTMEANALARLWWEIMGTLRFVEIPIWVAVVLSMAYLINRKSKFFAILWLDFLAFNHLLGFLTWLPYGTLDFLYLFVKVDWAISYAISLISISVSIPIAFVQNLIESRSAIAFPQNT